MYVAGLLPHSPCGNWAYCENLKFEENDLVTGLNLHTAGMLRTPHPPLWVKNHSLSKVVFVQEFIVVCGIAAQTELL
jgi:hypothetical protein